MMGQTYYRQYVRTVALERWHSSRACSYVSMQCCWIMLGRTYRSRKKDRLIFTESHAALEATLALIRCSSPIDFRVCTHMIGKKYDRAVDTMFCTSLLSELEHVPEHVDLQEGRSWPQTHRSWGPGNVSLSQRAKMVPASHPLGHLVFVSQQSPVLPCQGNRSCGVHSQGNRLSRNMSRHQ